MLAKSWIVGVSVLGLAIGLGGGVGRAADAPIVIGLEIPLSPPGDPVGGQMIRRGAELAVEYVNKEMKGVDGGKQIALSVEDTQGRIEAGVAGYRKLVGEDHAVAVTGSLPTARSISQVNVRSRTRSGVPTTIGTQGTSAAVTSPSKALPRGLPHPSLIDPIRAATWPRIDQEQGLEKGLAARRDDRLRHRPGRRDQEAGRGRENGPRHPGDHLSTDHASTDLTPAAPSCRSRRSSPMSSSYRGRASRRT